MCMCMCMLLRCRRVNGWRTQLRVLREWREHRPTWIPPSTWSTILDRIEYCGISGPAPSPGDASFVGAVLSGGRMSCREKNQRPAGKPGFLSLAVDVWRLRNELGESAVVISYRVARRARSRPQPRPLAHDRWARRIPQVPTSGRRRAGRYRRSRRHSGPRGSTTAS